MASGQKDTSFTFGSNVARTLVGIGTQSCLAWVLGPVGRGEYAACLVLTTLLIVVLGLGVEMAIVYYVGSRRLNLSDALSGGLAWAFLSGIIALGIGFLAVDLPIAFFEKAPASAFRLTLMIVPLGLCSLVFTRALIGLGRLVALSIITVARGIGVLAQTLILVNRAEMGVHGALLAIISSDVVMCMGCYIFIRARESVRVSWPSRDVLRTLIGYGARFYVGKLGRQLNFQLGPLVLAFFATKAELGIFAAGTAIIARVWMIPETVNIVLLPRTSLGERGRPELVAKCCRFSLLFSFVVVAGLLLLARPVVSVVLSPKFLPVVPLLWIMALGVVFRSYPKVLASYFNGMGRPGLNSIAVLAGLVVNIALVMVLFPSMGLPGAALALAIAYTVEVAFSVFWFIRISGVPFAQLWRLEGSDWVEFGEFLKAARRFVTPWRTA